MKKTLLLLVGVAVATLGFADQNPFKRAKERTQAHNKMKSIKFNDFQARTNAVIPTLIKQSYWDLSSSNWVSSMANKQVYQNDLLVVEYQLSYSLNDTQSRTTYTYNGNKKLVQVLGEQNAGGTYIPFYRYTISYFNNNLKEITLGESYDLMSMSWLPTVRYTTEYNTRGEQIKFLFEQYMNGMWSTQYGYSTLITYLNNTNKIVELVDSSFNFNTMLFEADYKEVKSYNASAEVNNILSYYNDGSGLELNSDDSIFYTNGIPTKLISYQYDNSTNMFEKTNLIDQLIWRNFDPTIDLFYNEPIGYTVSVWINNNWRFDERTSTTFPDNNGSSVSLTEVYNSNDMWVNQSRYSEFYDVNKNELEYSNENYNNQNNVWVTTYGEKFMYQYDVNNNIVEEINEEYNSTVGAYQKTNKYEYSDFITIALGVNTNKNTLETKLYPNPSANGTVSIQVNLLEASTLNIKITDMKGSVVYTDESNVGKGLNTIELKNLEQGMYIVELNTEYGISRTKLVVSN